MRSWIGRVCLGLGGFLVVAGLLGLVWAPGVVKRTPIDVDTTTYLDGEAGKIDLATGELVRNPIYAISVTRTDTEASTDEVVGWVQSSCVMIDGGGERECLADSPDMITAAVDVFATDRVSGLAVNEDVELPADATPHEGLVNKWPFDAQQQTYPYWDGTLGRSVDAEFARTDVADGTDVLVYTVRVEREPAEVAPGTRGTYSTSKEIWVEPRTGAILDQTESQQRWLEDGTPVLDLQLGFTDEQVRASAADARDNLALLALLTVLVPTVGLVGGPLLVALGILLVRRSAAAPTAAARRELAAAGR